MAFIRRMQIVPDTDSGLFMATSIKVAFATKDLKHVNQHFGSAQSFAVYAVNPERSELLEVIEFGRLKQDGNEDKLAVKLAQLEGCVAIYCHAIGASAVRQLMSRGMQPIKVYQDSLIDDLLNDLKDELASGPSAWLAKAIERQSGAKLDRFTQMEAEGWEE